LQVSINHNNKQCTLRQQNRQTTGCESRCRHGQGLFKRGEQNPTAKRCLPGPFTISSEIFKIRNQIENQTINQIRATQVRLFCGCSSGSFSMPPVNKQQDFQNQNNNQTYSASPYQISFQETRG